MVVTSTSGSADSLLIRGAVFIIWGRVPTTTVASILFSLFFIVEFNEAVLHPLLPRFRLLLW